MVIKGILLLIIAAIFAVVFIRFRNKELTRVQFLFWLLVWILAGLLVIDPGIPQGIADRIGVGRGVDLVMYGALLFLFYCTFRLFLHLERIERDITKIVRHIALSEKGNESGIRNQENNSSSFSA